MLPLIELLIEVIFALFAVLAESVILLINLGACLVELVVSLFVEGFVLGRVTSSRKAALEKGEPPPHPAPSWGAVGLFLLCIGAVGLIANARQIGRAIQTREVILQTEDGRGALCAGVVIEKSGEAQIQRTDHLGRLRVPRFGLTELRLRDVRYQPQVWKSGEIPSVIVVQPSPTARRLERVYQWLRPTKERK